MSVETAASTVTQGSLPEKLVAEGNFREDLLYRLNVVKLTLPPLRQRKEDVPLLVHHFLDKYTHEMNKKVPGISNAAMRALLAHEWRGNVRELENVIERAVILAEGREVDLQDLPFAAPADAEERTVELGLLGGVRERQRVTTHVVGVHDVSCACRGTARRR